MSTASNWRDVKAKAREAKARDETGDSGVHLGLYLTQEQTIGGPPDLEPRSLSECDEGFATARTYQPP